jgi:hypothetical protein
MGLADIDDRHVDRRHGGGSTLAKSRRRYYLSSRSCGHKRKEPEDENSNTRDCIRARWHGDAAAVRASKAGGRNRLLR